jgi:DNA-binding MarR family transcriptional regulator
MEQSSTKYSGIYHSYILAICANPGLTQDALGKHLCCGKCNVTRHMAFLENNGLIERRVGQRDKREMHVFPTEKMLALLPEVRAITREWNSRLSEGITEEELAIFHKVLDQMDRCSRKIVFEEGNGV